MSIFVGLESPKNKKQKRNWSVTNCTPQQRKLCADDGCELCYNKSFASHPKSNQWANENTVSPRMVSRGSSKKYLFKCNLCEHVFLMTVNNIVYNNSFCAFCSNQKRCDNNNCKYCFQNSFASHEKSKHWDVNLNNGILPRNISKSTQKLYWFICPDCKHNFQTYPQSIQNGAWCPFCVNKKRCAHLDCNFCFNHSFASQKEAKYWHKTRNRDVKPIDVPKSTSKLYWFLCPTCKHDFKMSLNQISQKHWCPFCVNRLRCQATDCKHCLNNSFATHVNAKDWNFKLNNYVSPRDVAKYSHKLYWFTCGICKHDFERTPAEIQDGNRCLFCGNQGKHCGKSNCQPCGLCCEVCLLKQARRKTKISNLNVCHTCFIDCLKRNPNETPLLQRAKISLEIYCLAELQRVVIENNFLSLYDCTTWDCTVLKGLNFKPDIFWAFDFNQNLFQSAGSCKLNTKDIAYVLQLEIVEESRVSHSNSRTPDDTTREYQIRTLFKKYNIPIGIVYFTVAHTKHANAHPNDVYFYKNEITNEYEIIEHKLDDWKKKWNSHLKH